MEKEPRKPVGGYFRKPHIYWERLRENQPTVIKPRKPKRCYFSVYENGRKVYKPAEPWKAPPIGTRAVVTEAGNKAGEIIQYIKTYIKGGYITEPWTQEKADAIAPRKPRKPGRGYIREPEPASRPVKVLSPIKVVWEYVKAA
jgi:hypothetical protein